MYLSTYASLLYLCRRLTPTSNIIMTLTKVGFQIGLHMQVKLKPEREKGKTKGGMLWERSMAHEFHHNSQYQNHFKIYREKNTPFPESAIPLQDYSKARIIKIKKQVTLN